MKQMWPKEYHWKTIPPLMTTILYMSAHMVRRLGVVKKNEVEIVRDGDSKHVLYIY